MGDGVEEGVLTLVAANLANEEDCVEDDTSDQGREEDNANDEDEDVFFALDDPGDVEGDGKASEQDTEGDEKGNRSAASSDVHGLVEV